MNLQEFYDENQDEIDQAFQRFTHIEELNFRGWDSFAREDSFWDFVAEYQDTVSDTKLKENTNE